MDRQKGTGVHWLPTLYMCYVKKGTEKKDATTVAS